MGACAGSREKKHGTDTNPDSGSVTSGAPRLRGISGSDMIKQRKAVESMEQELREKDAALAAKNVEIEKHQSELKKHQSELQRHKSQLQKHQSELRDAESKLKERDKEVERLQEELETRTIELESIRQETLAPGQAAGISQLGLSQLGQGSPLRQMLAVSQAAGLLESSSIKVSETVETFADAVGQKETQPSTTASDSDPTYRPISALAREPSAAPADKPASATTREQDPAQSRESSDAPADAKSRVAVSEAPPAYVDLDAGLPDPSSALLGIQTDGKDEGSLASSAVQIAAPRVFGDAASAVVDAKEDATDSPNGTSETMDRGATTEGLSSPADTMDGRVQPPAKAMGGPGSDQFTASGVDEEGRYAVVVHTSPFGAAIENCSVVSSRGEAARQGICIGDMVVAVNEEPVSSHKQLLNMFHTTPKPFVLHLVRRSGDTRASREQKKPSTSTLQPGPSQGRAIGDPQQELSQPKVGDQGGVDQAVFAQRETEDPEVDLKATQILSLKRTPLTNAGPQLTVAFVGGTDVIPQGYCKTWITTSGFDAGVDLTKHAHSKIFDPIKGFGSPDEYTFDLFDKELRTGDQLIITYMKKRGRVIKGKEKAREKLTVGVHFKSGYQTTLTLLFRVQSQKKWHDSRVTVCVKYVEPVWRRRRSKSPSRSRTRSPPSRRRSRSPAAATARARSLGRRGRGSRETRAVLGRQSTWDVSTSRPSSTYTSNLSNTMS